MPGKKGKSGRKKKETGKETVQSTHHNEDKEDMPTKKVGRPKKCTETPVETAATECSSISPQPPSYKPTESLKPKIVVGSTSDELGKRNSDLSKHWDKVIGPGLDALPPKNLPIKRVILARFWFFRSIDPRKKLEDICVQIAKEVRAIWLSAAIPVKAKSSVYRIVTQVVNEYLNLRRRTGAPGRNRSDQKYQQSLEKLVDLRPQDCLKLLDLKKYLQKNNGENWMDDYDFFKGQLMVNTTKCNSYCHLIRFISSYHIHVFLFMFYFYYYIHIQLFRYHRDVQIRPVLIPN